MASKKGKKGAKGKKNDDWEDAVSSKLSEMVVKEKDSGEEGEVEEEEEEKETVLNNAPRSAFALLMEEEESEEENEKEQTISDVVAKTTTTTTTAPKGKAKKKKEKQKKTEQEEDLDAILADLDKPTEKKGSKKKGKDRKDNEEEEENKEHGTVEQVEEGEKEEEMDEVEQMKKAEDDEAARKKREKKLKKKLKKKEEVGEQKTPEGDEPTAKREEKKEKDKGEKKPKKKTRADLIKEVLKRRQEAEEEAKKKREEEIRKQEEAIRRLEEEEQRKQEKKEREKQKKKEAIERQKAEGTYLTTAQKEKQRRQQAMLDQLRQQGHIVPVLGEEAPKKRPVYGRQRKRNVAKEEEKQSKESSPQEEVKPTPPEAVESWEKEKENEEETVEQVDDWEEMDETRKKVVQTAEKIAKVEEKESKREELLIDEDEELSSDESSTEGSSSEASSSSEEEEEEEVNKGGKGRETKEDIREKVRERLRKRHEEAELRRSVDSLRAPVVCVLGHVDTGKTKLLDTIRRTNVQEGEAGGITQQIGATQVPAQAIKDRTKMVKKFDADNMKIPGFLIIDTPGHESFSNLRSRGSSLCDLAILVVDIMHGLEPQTLESIQLLKKGNTPFVVALNKIDRLYNWKTNPQKDVEALVKQQEQNVQLEFRDRVNDVVAQFSEQGLNVALYYENKDLTEYVSMVPTSAFVGDGIGNILAYLAQFSAKLLATKLAFSDELDCSVLEVKALPGLGTTIDVVLVNGYLRVGDIVVLAGSEGPITTQIRELLMPQPLKELRVKNPYSHFKEVKGAQGVKILAKELDKALAGLPLRVATRLDECELLQEEAQATLDATLRAIKLSSTGVHVQASTLGSLEALLGFLKSQKIPYSGISIGPVHKKDVVKASTMLDHEPQWAVILAFDVKIDRDAQLVADQEGVKVFQADIIYHLQDAFLKHREEYRERKRREHQNLAIFPCRLRILPQYVFNSRNPIIVGTVVEKGTLKVGTPLCVPSKECLLLGTVSSIEQNKRSLDTAKAGTEACIKIENTTGDAPKMYGRHFDHDDALVSKISRETIDVCKKWFREDLTKADWQLVVELKKLLDIM